MLMRKRRAASPEAVGHREHPGGRADEAARYAPSDPAALEDLLAACRPLIEKYIRARARTSDDSDDLVQDVILKAIRHFPNFRGECPFSQWLLRIAANELKNYYRRLAGERVECMDLWDEENVGAPQHFLEDACPDVRENERLDVESLLSTVERLCSEDERNVMTMVYQGESFEEIAEILGQTGATVRSHFLRGRSKLLTHLVAFEPGRIGGENAIARAIELAKSPCSISLLSGAEERALGIRDTSSAEFRSACLKIARHLCLAAALIQFLGAAWTS